MKIELKDIQQFENVLTLHIFIETLVEKQGSKVCGLNRRVI